MIQSPSTYPRKVATMIATTKKPSSNAPSPKQNLNVPITLNTLRNYFNNNTTHYKNIN